MRNTSLRIAFLGLCVALLTIPMVIANAAGGRIEGKVIDPKGDAVVGATVTATDPTTSKSFTAKTDKQGHYKIEGMPAGNYSLVIVAQGFSEVHRESVKVEDGALATIDIPLEIAPVEAAVTVTAVKANVDPTYQQLRQQAKTAGEFGGPFATVNNLVIKRDAATFTLKSGEIYFAPAVSDRTFGAVFFGEGELTLTPPTENEKHALSLFTKQPSITEEFSKLVLRFTDKTVEEIKASPQVRMGTNGAQASHAEDAFRENQSLLRKTLRRNVELRELVDLDNPQRPGFFTAFIDGKRYNKLIFQFDPLGIPDVSPEEVLLSSYGDTDWGAWTAFHRADEIAKGTASSDEDHRIYDILHHEIDTVINGTKLTSTDTITFRGLDAGARVLPFRLFASLRVSHVKDEQGRDLDFIQENKSDDADFGVIWPEPMEASKIYKVTIEYAGGDALRDIGNGNFFLGPRDTWYPNNEGTASGDRATFDVTYHYPKGKTLIGTGSVAAAPPAAPATVATDGAQATASPSPADNHLVTVRWSSGETGLGFAGFNYGNFKKKEVLDPDTGYNIEFYANDATPYFMRNAEQNASMSTMGMAGSMLADTENATRLFTLYFGKLPFGRLALTQQPAGNFGQAWPTLVYMPFTAFMDQTQRYMASGGNINLATNEFFEDVAPHEIAHQWWGHMVGWKSYRDQWMSEGFAEFSASLFLQQVTRDHKKYSEFWDERRDRILLSRPFTRDLKPYTVGPVTQGYRLSSGKTGATYQFVVYPKGAYILQMLRMMMVDRKDGDKRFMAMMQDFIKSHYNQDVSTEDFKKIVEKYMTKMMDLDGNGKMDWFFNEWVYGTEIPTYKFEYDLGDGTNLNARVTQSGVSDNFKMLVPVYVDFGKGYTRIGAATVTGNSSVELKNIKLPQAAKHAAICAEKDVLAQSIQSSK
jgi:Carboxypeptidase regulatory-like domain/Peptidase family M1 domain